MKLTALALIGTSFLFVGCMSMSTLQTARTLKPDASQITIGGGYFKSPSADSATGTDLKFPYLEGGYRRGIMPNLDAGAKWTVPGSITVDGKYQFVDASGFAVASGLALGYLSASSGSYKSTAIDVQLPVYTSYDFTNWFSLYAAPKAIMRMSSTKDGGGAETSSTGALVGSSLGFKVGDTWGLYVEGTLMHSLKDKTNIAQFGGSLFF